MARSKYWQGGVVDRKTGTYIIRRVIAGVVYKRSTRCTTIEGALSELSRFEQNPSGYVPGGGPRPQKHLYADAVVQWLTYSVQVKGNTAQHAEHQSRYFGTWAKFLEDRGVIYLEDVTAAMVDEFIAWRRPLVKARHGEGAARGAHTLALEVAALKVLYAWASRPENQGGFLAVNPLERYRIPKRPRGSEVPKVFTLEWWDKIRPHLDERWQMIGDVLLGSAMRYSSLARLRPDDVDIEKDVLHLRGNAIKGKEGGTVYVSHAVALKARQLALVVIPPSSHGLNRALESASRRAGERYYSCHAFRHTAASLAIADGVRGKDLQKRLVHARFATTEGYIDKLGFDANPYRGRI